jgi:uncharacterized protein (DUF433 family)
MRLLILSIQVRFLLSLMKHYIANDPEIMSGQPCIVGTRIPVSLVLIQLSQGLSLKEIQKEYHWVPLVKFEGAIEELAEQFGHIPYEAHPAQT